MVTKPAIPVNKKTAVNTKQVPAKPSKTGTVISSTKKAPAKAAAPVKPVKVVVHGVKQTPKGPAPSKKTVALSKADSTAIRATNSMDEKVRIVAKSALKSTNIPAASKKAIVEAVVKGAKENADKAVAAKRMEVAVKKTGADIKGYQVSTHAKQAVFAAKRNASVQAKAPAKVVESKNVSPVKKALKAAKSVVASVTLTKGEAKKFYAAKTPADKTAVAVNAMLKDSKIPAAAKKAVVSAVVKTAAAARPSTKAVPAKKVEPAKKPTKAVKTKPVTAATLKSTPVAAPVPTTQSPSLAGSAPAKSDVNPFLEATQNRFLTNVAAPAPALKLPPEMSAEKAQAREKFLRDSFRTLVATARVGS